MSKTNDELNAVLIGAVHKTVDVFDTAAEFLAAQAPEVLEQLLMWNLVSSLMSFVTGIVVLYALQHFVRKYSGRGARLNPDSEYCKDHKQTLTHDENGNICPRTLLTFTVVAIAGSVAFAAVVNNMDWLQILVAEKIWLLEYAAKMIK
jgi:hypothetical protein